MNFNNIKYSSSINYYLYHLEIQIKKTAHQLPPKYGGCLQVGCLTVMDQIVRIAFQN